MYILFDLLDRVCVRVLDGEKERERKSKSGREVDRGREREREGGI